MNADDATTEVAGELQTDSSKSTSQAGFDKGRREKETVVDKVCAFHSSSSYTSSSKET